MRRFIFGFLVCFSLACLAQAQTESFWATTTVPANTTGDDSSSVELGMRFSANVAGSVTGARVYCASNSSGTHTVHLWNSAGTSLGTATLPSCSGWTAVNFATAIAITAGSTYTVSYHTTEYPWNTEFFTAALTSSNLTAPVNAGVYAYGSSPAFPSSTWEACNYWVDVLFTPGTTYTMSGNITAGATVTLSGTSSASMVATSGAYNFTVPNGSYTVTPTLSGYTFSPTSQNVTVSGANVSVPAFTANQVPPTYSISGTISPTAAASGTTVTLSGSANGTATVNASGNYTFNGMANGTYTVTPNSNSYTFTPSSTSISVNGANVTGVNFSGQALPVGSISVDVSTSTDASSAGSTISSSTFSTLSANELLLAFIATDHVSGTTTVTSVSGAGLTWVLVVRTNVQSGTAEIWRAFAPNPLSNVSVTANLSQSVYSSMTVMSFEGVDTTGTNGSGAIGAIGTGNSSKGAPTVSLITTRNDSWVFGVGEDFNKATTRTLGAGQTLIHQDLATSVSDTYWVQSQTSPTPLSGTTVTINDTAPTGDSYNLSICEILPAFTGGQTQTWSLSGTISPTAAGNGATVTLSGSASATTTANASGNYSFTGLANGSYTVAPSNGAYTFTPPNQAVSISGASMANVNFTGQAAVTTWSISGTISPTAAGNGATVTLSGSASATTAANASGNYSFSNLANGSYTVTPSNGTYTFTPPNQAVTISGANMSGVNFTGQAGVTQTWSISGTITSGSGATVTLSGTANGSTVADPSGNYSFTGLANGPYTVTPTLSGVSFSPPSQAVSVNGANVTGVNFGITTSTFSISGTISAVGGSNASVTLSGSASQVITASSSGAYSFTGLANGSYTITPSSTGYSFSPAEQSVVVNGASAPSLNFTAVTGYSISGTISPASAAVGATVTLSGPVNTTTTVTGSSTFTFAGLPAGSYTITPSRTTATFTPTNQSVSITNGSVGAIAFSASSTENVIFFDNFLQTTLNPEWTVISRHGEYSQGETECNIPQMVTSGNGLTITTEAESWSCGDFNIDGSVRHTPSSWPYITGDVQWTSQNFNTGTVTARAKFPPKAASLWPAIWMLGTNCQVTNIYTADTGYSNCPSIGTGGSSPYIEIDMTECYGSAWCQFHLANPNFGIGNGCDDVYNPQPDTNFHIFQTVWTATSVKQYMDGVLQTTCNQAIKGDMFLIIQTQTGGVGGTPNSTYLPAQLMVDWVKVTQP